MRKCYSPQRRKQFATEQFRELRSLGFRRKTASRILRVTRATLALRSVEWAQHCWEEEIRIQEEKAAHLVERLEEPEDADRTVTPGLVRTELRKRLEQCREQIVSNPDQTAVHLMEFLGVASPIGPFHEQLRIIDGALVAIKGFPLRSMARV